MQRSESYHMTLLCLCSYCVCVLDYNCASNILGKKAFKQAKKEKKNTIESFFLPKIKYLFKPLTEAHTEQKMNIRVAFTKLPEEVLETHFLFCYSYFDVHWFISAHLKHQ